MSAPTASRYAHRWRFRVTRTMPYSTAASGTVISATGSRIPMAPFALIRTPRNTSISTNRP